MHCRPTVSRHLARIVFAAPRQFRCHELLVSSKTGDFATPAFARVSLFRSFDVIGNTVEREVMVVSESTPFGGRTACALWGLNRLALASQLLCEAFGQPLAARRRMHLGASVALPGEAEHRNQFSARHKSLSAPTTSVLEPVPAMSAPTPPLSSVRRRMRCLQHGRLAPGRSPAWHSSGREGSSEIMTTELQHRSTGLMNCQEHLARTLAARTGKQSSAAKALAELDCRRAHGEQVCIYPARGAWIVGPV